MGETANIAAMADKLAPDLFSTFGWTKVGPTNHNWGCQDVNHGNKTHPSDVVFYYDEPYADVRTYLNCDLKSYKKGSITPGAVKAAIENLAKSVACAEKSAEWQELYTLKNVTASICGMLFVYNHDGAYDADFKKLLNEIAPADLGLPKGSKLIVFGPQDVYWLNNVRFDIQFSRGQGELPPADRCQFLYPDLVRRKLIHSTGHSAATVEALTAPWIMLESRNENGTRTGLDIYYRDAGNSIFEFMYLIDWLLHYNKVQSGVEIRIRTLNADRAAASFFERAVLTYVDNYRKSVDPETDLKKVSDLQLRLKSITARTIPQVVSTFSDIEIGMQ